MADMMQFDLVSPERKLASAEAASVLIPGMDGDLTATPNHAAFLTTLRPGIVSVDTGSEATEYFVSGGFAEMSGAGISVLAEQAMPKSEVTSEMLADILAAAEQAQENAHEDTLAAAALRVNDVKFLIEQLAL